MDHHRGALLGRTDEIRALHGLVAGARNGSGTAVVVRGEPGIGKTALLQFVAEDAAGVVILRCDGYEAESSVPYAALQRLGVGLLDDVATLSTRHRHALRVAWGLDEGEPPDRFLVGLSMLALLAVSGSRHPVVCLIDDAHWLDAESLGVLTFVGRRLQAESALLLFATRDDDDTDTHFAGIESIRLAGLDDTSALQLLRRSATGQVDVVAAAQIAAATGGNPLALIDLARELEVRGVSDIALQREPVPIGRRLEAHYLRAVRTTAEDVQMWLLLAAAESTGHVDLITLTAARLGLPGECAADAEREGLVTVGRTVMFRHPLVRSAVYGAASLADRRRVHRELATAAAQLGLVELEARNAAEGTTGVDAAVAARLETVADLAAKRGGLISQARLLARSAELTPAGPERNGRLLSAAESATEAGAVHLSQQLLDLLDADGLDPVQLGRLLSARVFIGLFVADPAVIVGASATMLQAADHFRGQDEEREQKALFHAFEFMNVSEQLTTGTTMPALGHRLADGAAGKHGTPAAVLRGLSALILRPYAEAVPLMREALDRLFALEDAELLRFNYIGFIFSTALFDVAASEQYLDRVSGIARDTGALRVLDVLLWVRSLFEIDRGDPSKSELHMEQVRELRRAIGFDAENVVNVSYLVWTGTPRDVVLAIGEIVRQMGFGGVYTSMRTALAVRDLGDGRYDDAYQLLGALIRERFVQVTDHQLADYVEAAARSGHLPDARRVAAHLAVMAEAAATPWLSGLSHRCQALITDDTDDTDPEQHYQRAIELLGKDRTPADLARAHLLYGEWLRRRKRRREARAHLRTAVDIFDRIGAPALAARTRTELAATGEKVTDRHVVGGVEMSAREAAIAQMAARGDTNAQIGASLFISVNTVDYHLRKVFSKLGITSRRQLAERIDHVP